MKHLFLIFLLTCFLCTTINAQTPSIKEQKMATEDFFKLTSEELLKIESSPEIQMLNGVTEPIPKELTTIMKSEPSAYLL